MRTLEFLACAAICSVVSACAPHRPSPRSDTKPAAALVAAGPTTPEDCDRVFGERMNAGDVDGLVALYEPGATLVRSNGTPATGTAAIREEAMGFMALKPSIVMNVKKVISGGDVAVLYNDWHLTGTDPKGKRFKLSGRASEVVRRQADGTWRFVIDDPDARGRH